MATASELKVKVAKIATIVEYLEDEQISQIEKDILLQTVRDLYSDILLTDTTKTVVENSKQEEQPVGEQQEAVVEHVDENVAGTVAAAVVPPVISVAFDDGEFDFSDLLKDKTSAVNAEVQEENAPVENVAAEEVHEEEVPAEEAEPEAEIEEPAAEFEPEEFDEPEPENIEDVDSAEEFEEEDDADEDLEDVEPETSEEVEPEAQEAVSESNFEETVTDDTEVNYSFNEEPLPEEQPTVEPEEPQVEEPVVNESVAEVAPVVEEPVAQEPVVETPQNVEVKPVEPEKPEPTHITLGEQLGQSRQSSLNDKFASNKPLEGSIGLKPITDIKSAIPLGERFRFTRMLFSGNGPAFDSTVAALNGMSSIEAADNYIRTNFSWDMDSPVVADFMNIVRRRYL